MANRLQASFEALYAVLEIPRVARRTVIVLLAIHTGLLAYSAYVHSPTLNEPGHLIAGLGHWKFGRFELYRVNPPLVRMVAALPVMAVGYNEDWSSFHEGPGDRPEMKMGADFISANGERSFLLFTIARWACIPFSWIGAIVCYLWARDLCSRPAGVMACTIWCFEPNILAHSSLITADAGAAALGLAACYTFWRWLKRPTWAQAVLTGIVLGLAELAKTTLILFYPLWPLMWLVYRWPDRSRMVVLDWLREAAMLIVRMLIGLYVLNLSYGFEGSFRKLKDFDFVSDLFVQKVMSDAHPAASNRFADSWIGNLPVPFPKNYLLGIDIQQRDFEYYSRPSYMRGEWRDRGWWYYYLYACAVKLPLGLWALGIIALAAASRCEGDRLAWRDCFILLFPAFAIFAVVSSKTGFSEHMRYVLPAFPFFYVAIATGTTRLLTERDGMIKPPMLGSQCGSRRMPLFSTLLVGSLSLWLVASSLWVYPHSLSYFNESVGGPLHGPRHLQSSNFDWGQDLRYLIWWFEQHPNEQLVDVAHFGFLDPRDVGVQLYRVPASIQELRDGLRHTTCSVAVSSTLLYGYRWHDDFGGASRLLHKAARERLLRRETIARRIGYSILLYRVAANKSGVAHEGV